MVDASRRSAWFDGAALHRSGACGCPTAAVAPLTSFRQPCDASTHFSSRLSPCTGPRCAHARADERASGQRAAATMPKKKDDDLDLRFDPREELGLDPKCTFDVHIARTASVPNLMTARRPTTPM